MQITTGKHFDAFKNELSLGDEVIFTHYYEGAPLLRGFIVAFKKKFAYVDCSAMLLSSRIQASYSRMCKLYRQKNK